MSDPTRLRALAWVARWYEAQHPGARTLHLSEWAEAEADQVERMAAGNTSGLRVEPGPSLPGAGASFGARPATQVRTRTSEGE